MARVVRRRSAPAQEEQRTCSQCGMPATVRYSNRARQIIDLCEDHEERFREALKKAEYTRED